LGFRVSRAQRALEFRVSPRGLVLKRFFDFVCVFLGLVVLSPLLGLIALVVKVSDGGPVFYRGLRTGLNGRQFRIWKFRTMVVDAEKTGVTATADDDPRVTRIGRFLRKYKLDELPQLVNVLVGEMSLVGPRPEVPQYTALFTAEEQAILGVRPGITDRATLWDIAEGAVLAGSDDPERVYLEKIRPEKTRLQLKYVRERTFGKDVKIILMTLWALVTRKRQR
jgi:lipopolysaccharide/colanic/teichoic acid biosynthesis glycosyltransferase